MRIRTVQMRGFKRFTDLTVTDIPSSAKLVVVVGPNGCGKSSLFDAFLNWRRWQTRNVISDDAYFLKNMPPGGEDYNATQNTVSIEFHGPVPDRNSIYVRTAHRNDPDFSERALSRPPDPETETLSRRLIDDDKTVAANYRRLVYLTASGVYDTANNDKTVRALREELIGAVQASMKRVFGDLVLHNIADPFGTNADSGSFFFEKGTAESYHYKNLSGGEKAAFDLLLDLHLKRQVFTDAVYCIDEVEAHLHTAVQGSLVEEIVKIIPDRSQLWLTTHSLGVLRAVQKIETATPGSTCIIDFEGADLDVACELYPVEADRVAWQKLLSIALDDLADLIAPQSIVICEGSSKGRGRKDFDAAIYSRVLGERAHGVTFVSGGSSDEVQRNGADLRGMLKAILPPTRIFTLLDRDDQSDEEVARLAADTIVLSERNLESYLFRDDVMAELVKETGQVELLDDVLRVRDGALAENRTRGRPSDDLKSAAGNIFVELRQLLDLRRSGNTVDSFMRDTLAPLIVPGMETYQLLRADVVDKLQ